MQTLQRSKEKISSNLDSESKRKNQSIIHTIEKPILLNLQAAQEQAEVKVEVEPQQKNPVAPVQPVSQSKPEQEVKVQMEDVKIQKEETKVAKLEIKSPPKEVSP